MVFSFRSAGSRLKSAAERLGTPKTHHVHLKADKEHLAAVAQEALAFFEAVPPFYDDDVPQVLRIGGAWRAILTETRGTQIEAVQTGDAALYGSLLQNFYKSELVSGLWNYGNNPTRRLSPNFIREIQTFQVETGRKPDELLAAGAIPSAWGLRLDSEEDSVVTYVAPSHGRQASHILNALEFMHAAGKTEAPTVLDIGSGFGGMALFLARWSARPLRIVLLDVPLNLATAYAFLRTAAPELRVKLFSDIQSLEFEAQNAKTTRETGPVILLVPTLFSEAAATWFPADLLHNAQSFGEMDAESVHFYLTTLVRPQTTVVIESNASEFGATTLWGHRELGNDGIASILRDEGFSLLARHSRDSWARYAVSTFLRGG